MTLRLIFACTLFITFCGALYAHAQTPNAADPAPGITRDLARYRAAHYSNILYALRIELVPHATLLKGTSQIRLTLDKDVEELVLDWRVAAVKGNESSARVWNIVANDKSVADARFTGDHILIPQRYLVSGENIINLNFESPVATSGSAVTRYLDREDNSEYIYTLFVPSDASTAFPCFDQPDLKARFQLDITAPLKWKVVTNTLAFEKNIIRYIPSANEARVKEDIQHIYFQETQPISTYLFAFAAGDFVEFRDDASPHKTRLLVRKSKAEKARKELAEVFRLHREGLMFLASYFDYPYPFPKYDVVIVPEFAYGGMEHAGCTFLREESILFPSDPTANDLLSRAEVIFHEAAHQWFGDLVTMRWFDDLWLKEGFATFMAYKAMEAISPERNAWKAFYQRTKPAAYLTDVTKGTTPIFQEIPNLSAAKSAYGNIVYRKAPSMLRQAEFYLGANNFQQAVRAFLKQHAYANAAWSDLVGEFARASGKNLNEWAAAWVTRRGMPDVRVAWSASADGRINRFIIKQQDVLQEGGAWPLRVKVLLAYEAGDKRAHAAASPQVLTVTLDGKAEETIVKEAIGLPRPAYVFANYEDYGYGRFLLDAESQKYVLAHLGTVRDDFLRALLWGALWDSVREAELAPIGYIQLAIENVGAEQDEVTAQSVLGRVATAYNRYLSNEQARDIAPRLERLIAERMRNAESIGLRITYFRAFQSIATTDDARLELKRILRGEEQIPGMTLRARDRFDIISALLSRDDREAPALLEALSAADKSDDERRYAFAAAAARNDAAIKKNYFDAYLNDTRLAESWIEASLNSFNTVAQSDLTLPYLEPALRQLPALKRTRKIFFVNNWLAAFIGGQRDARALAIVQKFLNDNALDRDLRLKVLETMDGLERAVRIRAKYAQSGTSG